MRHTRFVWFLLAGILSLACVKTPEESAPEAREYVTIQASLDASVTKTYLDGVQVKWEASDSIAVWFGTLNTAMDDTEYKVVSIGDDAREATFMGFAVSSPNYLAVYPYVASKDCSKKGKLTVAVPTVQPATPDGFAKNVNVAVAYSESTELVFQNVGGLVAVTLTSFGTHTVESLKLEGTTALSGEVEIKKADLPGVTTATAGVNYVELTGTFTAGSTYYFVVLPGSHTEFTLTLTDSEGNTATATSTYVYEITRNSNTLIADLTVGEGDWKAPPVEDPDNIVLNELQGNGQKYIELYNAGESTVSLSGWKLLKDESVVWTGSSESIAAKGYLVLYSSKNKGDYANPVGAVTFTGGLSAKKNVLVQLYKGELLKDSFQRGEGPGWGNIDLFENTEASFSRVPNGSAGAWKYAEATPGEANGEKTGTIEQYPAANGTVILNEINGNAKFIELHNTATDYKISLEDMTIQKDGGLVWTGAPGYAIEPGGYLVLTGNGSGTGTEFSSGLSPKKAVRVQLFGVRGDSLDDFNLVTLRFNPAPASYGRNSDDGLWYYQSASPGIANTDVEVEDKEANLVTGLASVPVMGAASKADIKTGGAVNVEEISGVCLSQGGDFLWGAGDDGSLWQIAPADATATQIVVGDGGKDLEGVTIDPSTGDLYLGGEPGSVYQCTSASSYGSISALFDVAEASEMGNSGIEGIAWYGGNLYLGAQSGATLWCYEPNGTKVSGGVSLTTKAPALKEIAGLCYDPVSDRLWVVDSKALTLFVFKGDASDLIASYYIGGFASGNPEGVCVDRSRNCVWIVEDGSSGNPSVLHKVLFENL